MSKSSRRAVSPGSILNGCRLARIFPSSGLFGAARRALIRRSAPALSRAFAPRHNAPETKRNARRSQPAGAPQLTTYETQCPLSWFPCSLLHGNRNELSELRCTHGTKCSKKQVKFSRRESPRGGLRDDKLGISLIKYLSEKKRKRKGFEKFKPPLPENGTSNGADFQGRPFSAPNCSVRFLSIRGIRTNDLDRPFKSVPNLAPNCLCPGKNPLARRVIIQPPQGLHPQHFYRRAY